jgi:hypothetical protein
MRGTYAYKLVSRFGKVDRNQNETGWHKAEVNGCTLSWYVGSYSGRVGSYHLSGPKVLRRWAKVLGDSGTTRVRVGSFTSTLAAALEERADLEHGGRKAHLRIVREGRTLTKRRAHVEVDGQEVYCHARRRHELLAMAEGALASGCVAPLLDWLEENRDSSTSGMIEVC